MHFISENNPLHLVCGKIPTEGGLPLTKYSLKIPLIILLVLTLMPLFLSSIYIIVGHNVIVGVGAGVGVGIG